MGRERVIVVDGVELWRVTDHVLVAVENNLFQKRDDETVFVQWRGKILCVGEVMMVMGVGVDPMLFV